MKKLKPIRYDELARKLQRAGYFAIRKSKHVIYFNPRGQITIPIPHKHSRDVRVGLLKAIIKEMRISNEDFNKL